MDLPLYMRVLWRFKILVGSGFVVAVLLAVLATARVDVAHGFKLSYRQSPDYSVASTLFVTQEGFPWGYAAPPDSSSATPQQQTSAEARMLGQKDFADPARFPGLAALYAYLAMSDPVRAIIARSGPVDGTIVATPVVSVQYGYGGTLPLVTIAASGTSPEAARSLVIRATDAFRTYLSEKQVENQIPAQNRVLVTVLQRADKPVLVKGRSKTLPIVVFVAVITSVFGLAFLLENVRPRVRPVRDDDGPARLPTPERQSA